MSGKGDLDKRNEILKKYWHQSSFLHPPISSLTLDTPEGKQNKKKNNKNKNKNIMIGCLPKSIKFDISTRRKSDFKRINYSEYLWIDEPLSI